VAAIGRPGFITGECIAPGATVIDVGQTRITDRAMAARFGKAEEFDRKGSALVGDVHPVDAAQRASAFTPVPGGVGPLTIAMLMSNTVDLAEQHQKGRRPSASRAVLRAGNPLLQRRSPISAAW